MAQKLSPKRGVRNTKGGAGRKRPQSDSDNDNAPVVTPYRWSTNKTRDKQTKADPKRIRTRASAITNDTDSENTTDSKEDEEDSVEVVGEVTKNTGGNLTTAALGNQLQTNTNDTIAALQESLDKLQARNQMLAHQIKNITKMGGWTSMNLCR